MEKKAFKAREVQPTVVRLPPELRDVLLREAHRRGVSLSKEITIRLQATVDEGVNTRADGIGAINGHPAAPDAKSGLTRYDTSEGAPAQQLSGTDSAMLALFRKLTVEKQLALLSLFK